MLAISGAGCSWRVTGNRGIRMSLPVTAGCRGVRGLAGRVAGRAGSGSWCLRAPAVDGRSVAGALKPVDLLVEGGLPEAINHAMSPPLRRPAKITETRQITLHLRRERPGPDAADDE